MKRIFNFEFLDGTTVSYEAASLEEAMQKRFEQFNDKAWTIRISGGSL